MADDRPSCQLNPLQLLSIQDRNKRHSGCQRRPKQQIAQTPPLDNLGTHEICQWELAHGEGCEVGERKPPACSPEDDLMNYDGGVECKLERGSPAQASIHAIDEAVPEQENVDGPVPGAAEFHEGRGVPECFVEAAVAEVRPVNRVRGCAAIMKDDNVVVMAMHSRAGGGQRAACSLTVQRRGSGLTRT